MKDSCEVIDYHSEDFWGGVAHSALRVPSPASGYPALGYDR